MSPDGLVFEIRPEHLTLLRGMRVDWWSAEFGAPGINPKRPYGNSDPYPDIAKLLHITPPGRFGEFSQAQVDYMDKLHNETRIALQILLHAGRLEPGQYRNVSQHAPYMEEWQRDGDAQR